MEREYPVIRKVDVVPFIPQVEKRMVDISEKSRQGYEVEQ